MMKENFYEKDRFSVRVKHSSIKSWIIAPCVWTFLTTIKLNKVQQKILDSFITHGTIKNQYVGRVAGVKKEKKFFAAKKQYKGSIENRNEALMKALKVNVHQKKILDSYLKTGKVIGKYAGSIAGSTKATKDYSAFRGFKEHVELLEGAEIYTVKKGSFTRKVDGKTADKMKRQGWKLVAKEDSKGRKVKLWKQ